MSADNWSPCPVCLNRLTAQVEEKRTEVDAAYGTVDVDQFLHLRNELAELEARLATFGEDHKHRTFREDYEFWGAVSGEVRWRYRGSCAREGCTAHATGEGTLPIEVKS